MLHKITQNLINPEKLSSVFTQHLSNAMKNIVKRRKSENLVGFSDMIEKYGYNEFQKKFNVPVSKLKQGYTNSTHFKTIERYLPVANYPVKPRLSYSLQQGKKPSAALAELFSEPNTVMFMDCVIASTIAQYSALLETLKLYLGETAAENIFNQLFSQMNFSYYGIAMGRRLSCTTPVGIFATLNPLSYFVRLSYDDIRPGDIAIVANHPDYVKKHPAGGYANCIVGCSEKQPVARYMGFDLDEAYTEDQIKQFMCEKYNKPRPSWMSGHWIKQMPGVDSAVFNLTNFPEQITETEVPGILNQAMVLRLDFTKLLALISKPTATAKKFDVYLDVETKAISVLRQVDLNKSLTVEPIVSEDNIELHLQNAHYKNHSATLHCHNNAFELAIRDYQAALESYRLIYHYLESRHHIASLRVVEEQIALSCFKLASVMIRNNFFDKAIPYLKEAHEIWQHLLGEMHEKTKQAEERLAQIKLNSVRLAGGAEYLQFFNSNKNKFIPAPDTSKTNERSIVPHRKM